MVTSTEDGLQGEALPKHWSHEERVSHQGHISSAAALLAKVHLTQGSSPPGVMVSSGRPPWHPAKPSTPSKSTSSSRQLSQTPWAEMDPEP